MSKRARAEARALAAALTPGKLIDRFESIVFQQGRYEVLGLYFTPAQEAERRAIKAALFAALAKPAPVPPS